MEIDIYKPLTFVLITIFIGKKPQGVSIKKIMSIALLAFLANLSTLQSIEQIKTDLLNRNGFVHYCISSIITMIIALIILLIYVFTNTRRKCE